MLILVIIVAVLASVSIYQYKNYIDKANIAQAVTQIGAFKGRVINNIIQEGTCFSSDSKQNMAIFSNGQAGQIMIEGDYIERGDREGSDLTGCKVRYVFLNFPSNLMGKWMAVDVHYDGTISRDYKEMPKEMWPDDKLIPKDF